MKSVLPLIACAAAVAVAGPAFACEQHQSHATLQTVEAVPAQPPVVVIQPAAQSNPTAEPRTVAPMSQPLGAAYGGGNRMRKDQTVYLTQ